MRWVFRVLTLLLSVALLLVVALSVYGWRSLPRLDGRLALAGLQHEVQVNRDASDVTHILARDPRDAWMALGYVHAQERAWQLEFNRRLMRGELSAVFGSTTLETDKLMRTLGIHRAASRQLQGLSQDTQVALRAYADGVNAFFAGQEQALPLEFLVLGADPTDEARSGQYWTPEDSVGWSLMMALDLGGNWGNEFARLTALEVIDTEALWTLFPPYPGERPAATADLATLYQDLDVYRRGAPTEQRSQSQGGVLAWLDDPGSNEGKGSNNWVVSGERSESGAPLLANDPHLGLSAPALWYFARLQAPDVASHKGLDVVGATLPGAPVVVLGRTREAAWAFTNTGPDVQDLYLEQLHPDDPSLYRVPSDDGLPRWMPFDERVERIAVKGAADVEHRVRHTRHGPVISDAQSRYADVIDTSRHVLALRWTALDDDVRNIDASLAANRARSVEDLIGAFANMHAPMQSVLMADRAGRIAFKAAGRVPLRHVDNDIQGVAPSPGWDARYDWIGWLPYDETPFDDGSRGWIATANQRVHGPDYPHFLTQDWVMPYRQQRIEQLLQARDRHSPESFRLMQADLHAESTRRLLPYLRAAKPAHELGEAALRVLADFDGVMRGDAAGPLIYSVWVDEFTRDVIGGRLGKARFEKLYGKRLFRSAVELILERNDAHWCGEGGCAAAVTTALDRALERIAKEQGRDPRSWRWDRAHPAISVHRPFSNVPYLAPWFEVRAPTGGDPFTLNVGQYHLDKADAPFANRHAASLRAIYDLSDAGQDLFIYQTGQSGHVMSRRYRDMSPSWADVRLRPLRMQPEGWERQLTLHP
ncbi:MAG: penicillin acylase family protein [Burkholderiales bacterium]|nr:MAG: penicillin acylase family protein [Burkholderiales bacterium]